MRTEPEYTSEQVREWKNRVATARSRTLAQLAETYKILGEQQDNLSKTVELIASLNETLREIDAVDSDAREREAVEAAVVLTGRFPEPGTCAHCGHRADAQEQGAAS